LWRHVARCLGTEGADRAGGEDRTAILACYLEDVEETAEADLPCQLRLGFGDSTQQCCQIEDRVDLVATYDFGDLLGIGNVYHFTRTSLEEFALGRSCRDVPCHDYGIESAERHSELGPDLACRADDKDVFHTSL
jgi:hypothetical protein